MSIVVKDPLLISQLQDANGTVYLESPDGQIIGQFQQNVGGLPKGAKLPFTDEELERRRLQRTGKSLSEILERLEAQG